MSVDAKWLGYEQWTLLEAAQIVAGLEPFDHAVVGDDPHAILGRIPEDSTRKLFEELYRWSKDAINIGHLAISEKSRTGRIGNTRVLPRAYLAGAQDRGFDLRPDLVKMIGTAPPSAESNQDAQSPTEQTVVKRSVMLERLAAKYPNLSGAISTNDPAFLDSRVPPEHAPGNKKGFYYLEKVEATCAARWSPRTSTGSNPPSKEKLGNF